MKTSSNGAVPRTTAEWTNYLEGLDTPEKFQGEFAAGTFKSNLQGYLAAQNAERTELLNQVKEQTEAQITDFLKENLATLGNRGANQRLNLDSARIKDALPSVQFNNPKASGAPLNGLFPDFYSFLQAIWHGNKAPSAEIADKLRLVNEYSEKIPAEGGYLVPEEWRSQVMQLAMESSIVRPRAQVIPMSGPRLHLPTIDETSRVSSVFGGIVVYRTEEGEELTESASSFASIKLDVTKQTALTHVTNELVRDWGAFASFISQNLPRAMGFYEDIDFISGTGVGEPLGALHANNTALITVAAAGGQLANTIVWENIIGMYARMMPSSIPTSVWVASPDTFVELATMALTVGNGGSAVWLTDGRNEPVLTLLGRPVLMTEKAPAALGSVGDLSFVDFRMYLIGDYQTMTIDSSPHVKFTSDKTTFRAIARNDGRPAILSPLTPHNNSATLSPFVQLGARP